MTQTARSFDTPTQQPQTESYRQRRQRERGGNRLDPPTVDIPRGGKFTERLPPSLSPLEKLVMKYVREKTDAFGRDFHHTPKLAAFKLGEKELSVRNVL